MKSVLIVGDPVDGYMFYGPFETAAEANAFADFEFRDGNWWVADMTAPVHVPAELEGILTITDFLLFEEDWARTNRIRGNLIDKNIAGTLSEAERVRLDMLQAYADYHVQTVAPRPDPGSKL